MRAALAPLKLPGFRHLGIAYTVNELGNWLGEIALAVLVFNETGSPLATAALFLGMQFVPALFAQGLVARTEVLGTRVILPAIYLAEAVTFIALAVIAESFVLAAIIALAVLDGTLALAGRAFVRAAAATVLKPAGQLRQGNALLNVGFTVAGAAGPAIGGLLVAGFGVVTALLLDAASFLVVALTLASAHSLPDSRAEPHPWRTRLRQGFEYVSHSQTLRRLLGAQATVFVFFSAVIPIEVVYAKEALETGDAGYGALLAGWGAGMIVGSLVFVAARRITLQVLLFFSTLAVGVAYLGLAAAGTLLVACLVAALGGIGNGVQWISMISAVQEQTTSQYQARVVGLLESTASATLGIGFVIGGVAAAIFSPRTSFVVAGTGVIVVLAVAVRLLVRVDWEPQDEIDISTAEQIGAAQPPTAPHLITRP